MNLLVIDATRSRVAFAVFSAATRLEEILSGRFDSADGEPLSVTDATGREMVATSIPQGLGDEAYLAWLMQWLEARNIRVDLVCHRVIRGAGPRASLTVIQYLSTVYRHVPQVACALIENGLDALARQGLTSLSLPLPIARTVSSPLYVQRSGANAATRPAL